MRPVSKDNSLTDGTSARVQSGERRSEIPPATGDSEHSGRTGRPGGGGEATACRGRRCRRDDDSPHIVIVSSFFPGRCGWERCITSAEGCCVGGVAGWGGGAGGGRGSSEAGLVVVDVAGFAWEEFQVEKGVTFERSKRRETER